MQVDTCQGNDVVRAEDGLGRDTHVLPTFSPRCGGVAGVFFSQKSRLADAETGGQQQNSHQWSSLDDNLHVWASPRSDSHQQRADMGVLHRKSSRHRCPPFYSGPYTTTAVLPESPPRIPTRTSRTCAAPGRLPLYQQVHVPHGCHLSHPRHSAVRCFDEQHSRVTASILSAHIAVQQTRRTPLPAA